MKQKIMTYEYDPRLDDEWESTWDLVTFYWNNQEYDDWYN